VAIGDITHDKVNGTLLTGTLATLYTVAANLTVIALEIVINNTDSVVQYPEVQIIPTGGSAGDATKVIQTRSVGGNGLQPGEDMHRNFNPMMLAGDFIQARNTDGAAGSGTTNKLSIRLGLTLKQTS
jgi:hypothetical protein